MVKARRTLEIILLAAIMAAAVVAHLAAAGAGSTPDSACPQGSGLIGDPAAAAVDGLPLGMKIAQCRECCLARCAEPAARRACLVRCRPLDPSAP